MAYTLLLYLSEEFDFSDREAGWTYGLMGLLISVYGFAIGAPGRRRRARRGRSRVDRRSRRSAQAS